MNKVEELSSGKLWVLWHHLKLLSCAVCYIGSNEVGWAVLVRCSVTVQRVSSLHAHRSEFLLIVFIYQFVQVPTQDKSQVFCFHIVICSVTDFTKLSRAHNTYYSGCIFEIRIFKQGWIAYASFDITTENVNNIISGDCWTCKSHRWCVWCCLTPSTLPVVVLRSCWSVSANGLALMKVIRWLSVLPQSVWTKWLGNKTEMQGSISTGSYRKTTWVNEEVADPWGFFLWPE